MTTWQLAENCLEYRHSQSALSYSFKTLRAGMELHESRCVNESPISMASCVGDLHVFAK